MMLPMKKLGIACTLGALVLSALSCSDEAGEDQPKSDSGTPIEGGGDAGPRVDASPGVDATVAGDVMSAVDALPMFATLQLKVPGTANPWLAGLPDGATAAAGDVAPTQSPVLVGAVWPGLRLVFSATGGVHFQGGAVGTSPDGGGPAGTGSHGAENGMSGVTVPWDSLLGVFVGPGDARDSAAPTMVLDFTGAQGTGFATLSPELKQVFFIGDGLTGTGDGAQQIFTVPPGATRLFLGSADGSGWLNNIGEFAVTVSAL
jgi:hypothetical protein